MLDVYNPTAMHDKVLLINIPPETETETLVETDKKSEETDVSLRDSAVVPQENIGQSGGRQLCVACHWPTVWLAG